MGGLQRGDLDMDYVRLEKNISDVIKEEQVKLGYRSEVIRLYYPLQSLNRFLGTNCDINGMYQVLEGFCVSVCDKFGKVEVSNNNERFCLLFPKEASEYVYRNTEKTGFIYDFINTVSKHGATIDDVLEQFRKYSDHVHIEKVTHGEFDYLVYFEDGVPDDFRYCLTNEGCHVIYHRFTVEDYEDFKFEDKE
jgi:hypothetical protein